MAPRVLFATTNAGKLRELRLLMDGALEVLGLADLPPIPEPAEDAPTFEQNAQLKAQAYAAACGLPALADDSGLCVDALGGAPGVLSARYAPGDDRARYLKLLQALEGVPDAQRGASFRCALALALPGGRTVVEVGACTGRIAHAPRGEHGFGYDPVFLLADGRTLAEYGAAEKGRISHRGAAFRLMRPHLLALAQP
ncbi:MAG TPA: RdgB/HAM1 family non-canonical purine NTP pyrophosphatase [Aggregicoccus sp.]|nr:RdgB/HAM1 family non-canonical purine NTP pyrophosphatase [Aggregicoccus sp.]